MREFLKDVWMHGGEESRAITPENITGEKGRAAMSASHLGVGRKARAACPLSPARPSRSRTSRDPASSATSG